MLLLFGDLVNCDQYTISNAPHTIMVATRMIPARIHQLIAHLLPINMYISNALSKLHDNFVAYIFFWCMCSIHCALQVEAEAEAEAEVQAVNQLHCLLVV